MKIYGFKFRSVYKNIALNLNADNCLKKLNIKILGSFRNFNFEFLDDSLN